MQKTFYILSMVIFTAPINGMDSSLEIKNFRPDLENINKLTYINKQTQALIKVITAAEKNKDSLTKKQLSDLNNHSEALQKINNETFTLFWNLAYQLNSFSSHKQSFTKKLSSLQIDPSDDSVDPRANDETALQELINGKVPCNGQEAHQWIRNKYQIG